MGSLSSSQVQEEVISTENDNLKNNEQSTMDVGHVQTKAVGGLLTPINSTTPKLFTPFAIRGVTFKNKFFVSPMCMYSCDKQDGIMTDFHLAHYGNLALRGPALVVIEATSVEPRGRLSPQDTGIWSDEHIGPLRRIVNLAHASGAKIGIQIAHGGRKAGTRQPFYMFEENGGKLSRDGAVVPKHEGGFPDDFVAPSPIPWKEGGLFPTPHELTTEEVEEIVQKFVDAARRAVEAGVDVIEIHGAHGYLIHSFLSGNTNKRTDKYGGTPEKRQQFLIEIVEAVRAVIPKEMPLFCRVSGSDCVGNDILSPDPEGWDVYQLTDLCHKIAPLGVDLIDISSGNNLSTRGGVFLGGHGYHLPLSEEVKKAKIHGLLVGSVGALHEGQVAEGALQQGKADVVFVGRGFVNDPNLVQTVAKELGVYARWADQYSWFHDFPQLKLDANIM